MTVLYVTANTGYSGMIAASEDRRKLEERMYEWCRERGIVSEYYHGDYRFSFQTGIGNVSGWFRFDETDVI